jgi:murein peptide amidase A
MTPAGLAIAGVVIFWLGLIAALSFVKTPLPFSYGGNACINQFTLFPDIAAQSGDEAYVVEFRNPVKIGSWTFASQQTCVTPLVAPEVGSTIVTYGPWGLSYPSRTLEVVVPEAPVARVDAVIGKTISIARPLVVELTAADAVYDYTMIVDGQAVDCLPRGDDLSCDVHTLDLAQGAEYETSFTRTFAGVQRTQLGSGTITTLQPVKMTESSLERDQVRYDKPTEFSFTFDKPVEAVEATLEKIDGESQSKVAITTDTSKSRVIVKPAEELPRKAQYQLVLEEVIADDGSSLAEPLTIPFTTSGGPKVAAVSVGSSGVTQNAQITVTFDQPIHDDVDITRFASIQGVGGSVRKISETQIVFGLQDTPICAPFSLAITKGVKSGSNDEIAADDWTFNSRIICGYASVIGYSVRGRPIIAHYFGSGATTILFTGGIHGNEQSSQQTMQAWADHLYANAHKLPGNKRVVVVPNLNPDGIAAGSRNNVNNVNLGRNFPSANWSASIQTASGTLPTGGGTSPLSEPEAQAIANLTRQLRPRLEVSFHSQGRLVGANKTADSVAIGNIYASTVGYGTMYYNAEEVMGYPITGEYEEWMGEQMGIPAILIELPSHYGNYLSGQLNALWKMMNV